MYNAPRLNSVAARSYASECCVTFFEGLKASFQANEIFADVLDALMGNLAYMAQTWA